MTNTEIHINDHGKPLTLNYSDALKYHRGNSYWGVALAFRMLQYAAKLLCREKPWERQELSIVSGHPGPGVRDTIEYVTGCVSAGRFTLTCDSGEPRCVSEMEYKWQLRHGREYLDLQLAQGIVPPEFFQLLDKINQNQASEQQYERLETLKKSMTANIWSLELEQAFPDARLTRD